MSTSSVFEFVTKSRRFQASPGRVFRAWTSKDDLLTWWQPGRYRTESVRIDLRVGGSYEIDMIDPHGRRQRLSGVYIEVEESRRLVMTWRIEGSPADDGYDAILTLEFEADGAGCRLLLKHEKLRPAGLSAFSAGWDGLLPILANHLEQTGVP